MNAPGRHAPLHVAIVAPPWFTVPPRGYGGVENVCADLVERPDGPRAHGDPGRCRRQRYSGRFVATYDEPPSARLGEPLPEVLHAAAAARALADLSPDVVHDHTLAGPLQARGRDVPTVVTMHGPVAGEAGEYYRQLGSTIDLVAISAAQRRSAPDLPWVGTVHNAVDVETFPFRTDKDDVLLFLGRVHPDKGVHLAIDAARAAGLPIVVAGGARLVDREVHSFVGCTRPRKSSTSSLSVRNGKVSTSTALCTVPTHGRSGADRRCAAEIATRSIVLPSCR